MSGSLGFLSVRRHPEHGYFGGYLITNQLARPLEFHCTMPVKPSRAQELLYGSTIDDFVCGEQIAKALTMRAKLKPQLVITDCPAVLAISLVSSVVPALLQFKASDGNPHFQSPRGDNWEGGMRRIALDRWQFWVPVDSNISEDQLSELLGGLASNFDLTEPFQRITEALLEAHPIAKAA